MGKEIISVTHRTLAIRFNGLFSLTNRGHLAHDLVLTHRALRNDANPKKQFSMSEKLRLEYQAKEDELCRELGLPENARVREKMIQGYSGYLARVGLPYYRAINK